MSAVQEIIANCRDIVRNVEEMTDETGQLVGVEGNGGRSFFAGLESGFSSLISAVSDYIDVNRELSSALYRVTGTVDQMSSFVNEIEKIGLRMKMVAVNASVHAAHIGEEGLGLGVLAEALHPLSVETSRQIGSIADALKAIVTSSRELTTNLNGDAAAPGEGGGDTEWIAEHLKAMMTPLRRLDEDNLSSLARIDKAVNTLSEDVDRATAAIGVHERIDQKVCEVDADLTNIVTDMRSALPAGESRPGRIHLEGLSDRYTMDKEREIHQSITASMNEETTQHRRDTSLSGRMSGRRQGSGGQGLAMAVAPAADGKSPAETAKEDLGDNVELF